MSLEMIDQLDEFGNYIGTVDKEIAHRDGLWHRAVHVWIVNDKNEIMLQYRCARKNFFPNVWDVSFAGHVDSGEDSLDAVIREGKEELGIDVDVTKISHIITLKEQLVYGDIISNEFVDIFILKDNIKIEDLVLQDKEVSAVKYMPITDFFDAIYHTNENIMQHKEEYYQLRYILK